WIIEQSTGGARGISPCRSDIPVRRITTTEFRPREKRFLPRRCFISHRTGNQSRNRIHDDCRSQFPAAQNIIADRNFAIREIRSHALVHAFVAPANQYQPVERRELSSPVLIKTLALGRE